MNPSNDNEFTKAQTKQADALAAIGAAIGRLAQAVENANAIAVKHNQWIRREGGMVTDA